MKEGESTDVGHRIYIESEYSNNEVEISKDDVIAGIRNTIYSIDPSWFEFQF